MVYYGSGGRLATVALLLLTGCKSVDINEHRSADSLYLQSRAATAIETANRDRAFERIEIVSIMELDTATGALRETRRETRTERTTDKATEKIENKAENNAFEEFSSKSETSYHETQQNVANDTKMALRWQRRLIIFIIAAIVAALLFLRLKFKIPRL